ncbi:MAG: DUF1868 domain-containing protein [Phenylobacterium sp.]|uniref:DUF1868 domain-containing protein n=1 Tax=Phenylobacterium sp. TaxID=1871053 RepID=UPI003BB77911
MSHPKFHRDGRPKPYAGNTVIACLPQDGWLARGMAAIREEAQASGFAGKLALLPVTSYHMTVFGGADDQKRSLDLWPQGVPLDAPMSDCDAIVGERLKAVTCAPPYRLRVDLEKPVQPFRFELTPVDAKEERRLRDLRDWLSAATGIRKPGHDAYGFHTQMGYMLEPFTADEQTAFEAAFVAWRAGLAGHVLYLGAPDYCTFADMLAFRQRLRLS